MFAKQGEYPASAKVSTDTALSRTPALVLPPARHDAVRLNLLGDLFDGDKLKEQKPYERPLLPSLVKDSVRSYALQEKMLSFSGEDFRVRDLDGTEIIAIDGGNINLGGWVLDKLAFKETATGEKFCSVERRALAASTCYDIYSPSGELLAKVERQWLTATPKSRRALAHAVTIQVWRYCDSSFKLEISILAPRTNLLYNFDCTKFAASLYFGVM